MHKIQNNVHEKLIPERFGVGVFGQEDLQGRYWLERTDSERFRKEKQYSSRVSRPIGRLRQLVKVYSITKRYELTQVIVSMLQNRRFYISLEGKKSMWRIQKNGFPQCCVLFPMLFISYTNDQPILVRQSTSSMMTIRQQQLKTKTFHQFRKDWKMIYHRCQPMTNIII